ncbi:MAG: N-6 DNA methylase [Bacteroidales bacterium]|jgi:type I restriction enzyme M protein|nr:N-6 DNA methylase [Bacteroidales bacterium]
MLNKDIKKKIDDARDTLVGVLPLPTDQIEIITIALIYKFMDDQDEELRQVGLNEKFFTAELKEFSWQQLMSNQLSADSRVTKFINGIEAIQKAKHIPALFREIFLNAFLKFRDAKVLQRFLDLIDGFKYDHSEELGNAFEYLLKTMGAQGDNGQFRTPRNIIDFMVAVVDPTKDETILDPACGTGGFLVSAFKHILRRNTEGYETAKIELENYVAEGIPVYWGAKLSSSQRNAIEKNIAGYDNTPLMVRLARVNLYLHHFGNPQIHEYNTLNTDTRWKDKYDCILANPPFMTPKGGIDPHDKFRIQANRTEILFASYILQHLNPDGKAGFVVPEGIIFQTSGDYVQLRNWMIYEAGLWAVVSLPAQIFQPYSGVKTSIIFIDREIARQRKEILLVKVDNDGFSLNTNRNEIKENDLPEALNWLELCKTDLPRFVKSFEVNKDNAFSKKIRLLHRDEFARLDNYKATSSAYSFCKKQYEKTLKAKEELETKLEVEPDNGIKAKEKYERQVSDFYKQTGINFLPDTEDKHKEWFEENIKVAAIEYGVNLNNINKLTKELLDFIDWQRDYNLSFDKFSKSEQESKHYDLVPLGELCEIFDSIRKPIKESERVKGIFPYYGATGIVDYVNEFLFDDRFVLVGEDGAKWLSGEKTAFIAEGKFWANNHVHVLKPKKEILIDTYLVEILNQLDLSQYITGVTVPKLNQEKLKSIPIPIPPLEIQQKVVDDLKHIYKLIEGCNLLNENYNPVFEVEECWVTVSLNDVCEITSSKRIFQSEYVSSGVPFFRTKEIVELSNNEPISLELFITQERYDDIKKNFGVPEKGDILLSAVGTIGVSWLVSDDSPFYFKDGNLLWFRNFKNINSTFLKYVLDSIFNQKNNALSFGAAYNALTIVKLKQVSIPLPPIEAQEKIVKDISIDLEAIHQAKKLKEKMQLKIKFIIDKVWGR